jgi:mercuric ion binding protein
MGSHGAGRSYVDNRLLGTIFLLKDFQMNRIIVLMLFLIATSFTVGDTNAGNGKEIQATFHVDKMTCATCPITVRKAMQRVDGVKEVIVDFDSKTATVIYDPSFTDAEKIAASSTNVGFPATPTEDKAH